MSGWKRRLNGWSTVDSVDSLPSLSSGFRGGGGGDERV